MPLSDRQRLEQPAREEAAAEHANRGLILVERGDWFGIYSTQDACVELISRNKATARRMLVARRRDDPFWRDIR